MESIIHRVNKNREHPYTEVLNAIIDNTELSVEARMILIKMLRNIDGYSYSIKSISKSTGISVAKVSKALKELTTIGYLRIHKSRPKGTGAGRDFIIVYEIFEEPVAKISQLEGTV